MSVPLAQQQTELPPMIIPIHTPPSSNGDGDDIPEWAMLELNGELLMPQENTPGKENPSSNNNNNGGDEDGSNGSLIPPHHVELGAIEFVDNVRVCSNPSSIDMGLCYSVDKL